ncbi:hypothetical protein PFICI_01391 [Pestalotiopsis fici W106-1]|uniref:Uncharacterized protein n=1 Tax=Pestalotiopsis fici (strain W106-1 / CGMCC3.15140) TaxID=1229662 RepID=W3XNC8_PESFW|nr:uncharacterized protein PFICI_01391 [Pestalotiopsis fici W106-1]ETS87563.1 hypothetical protein PFICI_01391 [Pestalotiopsis fici W106-1]
MGSQVRPARHQPAAAAQYRPQQPMSMGPPVSSRRARKPEPITVAHHQTYRPVIVQKAPHYIPEAQSAQFYDASVPRNYPRRDSNGVSEFGSEDGDSPSFRNYKVSPREVSPLTQQNYSGYQSWPAGR